MRGWLQRPPLLLTNDLRYGHSAIDEPGIEECFQQRGSDDENGRHDVTERRAELRADRLGR
jgi:hypothetical protein